MKRIPLYLLSILFGLITQIRNYFYDKGWFKSFSFPNNKIIVVGNLAVGGTGKSPVVHYLLKNWREVQFPVVLSRGYGRKTKGFLWAKAVETASTIGDEPLTYRMAFPNLELALGENRVKAIQKILTEKPKTQSIILDDAFQHRALRADFNIVCTTYQRPFYSDELLPLGRLREDISGLNRAQLVLMNKCPNDLSHQEINEITFKIQQIAGWEIPVFFTGIRYSEPVSQLASEPVSQLASEPVGKFFNSPILQFYAVAGIAHPELFFSEIANRFDLIGCKTFPDHYDFTVNDLQEFESKAKQMSDVQGIITTQKDYVRLLPYLDEYPHLKAKLSYLPMEMYFIQQEAEFWKVLGLERN
ncbi:tetraacyldisaccharide 4'-kinase [Sandaracinomonas limnophila]|uniref:Tetraacyldisaccharide 4'-kinase n=1 Tax=Sandaracinomonas limnophila TaxID=1862386 RepID=A0A437PXB1_9BACT|nr:tetraacyldisaccharide 4'-kinase [Sandaracinomonas limnophila]RVU26904.1 tetraacyldisaccharide 4'-kinase [Sandaracinomonas limnophila]